MSYGTHKDRDPAGTVAAARSILNELGIMPMERRWDRVGHAIYSVKLEDPEMGVCVNGKGVSKELALASAYGEFLERLQNGYLYPESFGLMKQPVFEWPDAQVVERAGYANIEDLDAEGIVRKAFELDDEAENVTCLPCYSVTAGRKCLLPKTIITSSNGMCAGNTPEEAILQGLCELLERIQVRRIYLENARVATIPLSFFKDTDIPDLVHSYAPTGCTVRFLDLTSGGKYPVLAVLLMDEHRRRSLLSVGSDVDVECCAQRCLTEAFQNYSENEVSLKMLPVNVHGQALLVAQRDSDDQRLLKSQYSLFVTNGGAQLPADILLSAPSDTRFQDAFPRDFTGHKDALRELLGSLHKEEFTVYVRDVGFLGFPAYQVFAFDDWSRTRGFGLGAWSAARREESRLREKLSRLPALTSAEQASLAEDLFGRIMDDATLAIRGAEACGVASHRSGPWTWDLSNTPLAWLALSCFYKTGQYELALACADTTEETLLMEFLGGREEIEKILNRAAKVNQNRVVHGRQRLKQLRNPVCLYLACLVQGLSKEEGADQTCRVFGEEAMRETLQLLELEGFMLPVCGDCDPCPIASHCLYDYWKGITEKLNRKAARFPAQDRIAGLFNSKP